MARRPVVRLIPYPTAPPALEVRGSLALAPGYAPGNAPPPVRLVPDPPAGSLPGRPVVRVLPAPLSPPAPPGPPRPPGPAADEEDGVSWVAPVTEDLETTAEVITLLIVEALAGLRAMPQLARRMAPPVYEALPRMDRGHGRRQQRPRLCGLRIQRPATRVAEVSALVLVAGRRHALAMRLEPYNGRWRCTALETTLT